MIEFGFCCKCSDAKTKKLEPTKNGIVGHEIVGCKKLTPTEWKRGIKTEPSWHQSKCPIMVARKWRMM